MNLITEDSFPIEEGREKMKEYFSKHLKNIELYAVTVCGTAVS